MKIKERTVCTAKCRTHRVLVSYVNYKKRCYKTHRTKL